MTVVSMNVVAIESGRPLNWPEHMPLPFQVEYAEDQIKALKQARKQVGSLWMEAHKHIEHFLKTGEPVRSITWDGRSACVAVGSLLPEGEADSTTDDSKNDKSVAIALQSDAGDVLLYVLFPDPNTADGSRAFFLDPDGLPMRVH